MLSYTGPGSSCARAWSGTGLPSPTRHDALAPNLPTSQHAGVAREDRLLPWHDRLALCLQMAVCAACPTFERQVFTMRNAMRQWRNYEEHGTPTANSDQPPDDRKAAALTLSSIMRKKNCENMELGA